MQQVRPFFTSIHVCCDGKKNKERKVDKIKRRRGGDASLQDVSAGDHACSRSSRSSMNDGDIFQRSDWSGGRPLIHLLSGTQPPLQQGCVWSDPALLLCKFNPVFTIVNTKLSYWTCRFDVLYMSGFKLRLPKSLVYWWASVSMGHKIILLNLRVCVCVCLTLTRSQRGKCWG